MDGARVIGMPVPGLMAALNAPVARAFARSSDANDAQIRSDVAALPALLDHVDRLIAEGTIGASEPNAADFQIGTSVRVLLAFEDLRPAVEGRPASDLAMRLLPSYPGSLPQVLPRNSLVPVELR